MLICSHMLCVLCQPYLTLSLYRILSNHTTDSDNKQRFLLNGLSQMQLAVTLQEHVVLNAENLLNPQEEVNKVHVFFEKLFTVMMPKTLGGTIIFHMFRGTATPFNFLLRIF